ncbi:MAG: mechanosensitive ion channel family protein [Halanaerobiales bacterium]
MDWLRELDIKLLSDTIGNEVFYTVIIILIISLIKWIFNRFVNDKIGEVKARYRWRKTTTYLAFFIGIILILPMWVKGFSSFVTYLGLSTAGLAIALRDLLASMIAWVFIIWKRPFKLGDRIEIDGVAGDVIDIRLFQFTIVEIGNWVKADQSTGRVVHIPNNKVLLQDVANYTMGFSFVWNEIPVLITFESDWQEAKKILLDIAEKQSGEMKELARKRIKEASKKFMIFYGNLSPIVYTKIKESGVLLTIRYLCEPRKRRSSESLIWEEILTTFTDFENIDFAYPTNRFYFKEGYENRLHSFGMEGEDRIND